MSEVTLRVHGGGRDAGLIETGAQVIALAAAGLEALARSLDARFVAAVEILLATRGRVIVTGMGKSGHIANKIAATLASTGTPAFFVHPSEASHGDLGMLTREDSVLAFSKRGENAELSDLILYTRRNGLKLIAVTAQADSALARAADVALLIPAVDEAGPMGLAPTTSTTTMLALGDALAMAALSRRSFTAADFRDLHPGGALGALLLRVDALMHTGGEVPLVASGMRMAEVLIEMSAKRFGCVGVVDAGGTLLGVITDGDLRRHMAADLLDRPADQVMTRGAQTIAPEMLAVEALALMNARAITTLFVIDGAKPVGILHIHDLLRAGLR
jgi:arabinose-5-phosphate isomerase